MLGLGCAGKGLGLNPVYPNIVALYCLSEKKPGKLWMIIEFCAM